MSVIKNIYDGLVNVVANLGTGRDKAASSTYAVEFMSPAELLTAYRSSWLARAIIDYPAEDATRKWRMWRADAEQITKIEALEKSLKVQKRVQDALVAARLFGGAAIYINTEDGGQDQPLKVGAEIKSLIVLTNNTLNAGEIVRDINSEYYGKPEYYHLTHGKDSQRTEIHASRLVIFRGASLPDDTESYLQYGQSNWGGDSILQSTIESIRQTDSTMANIASLVFEAKVDVFKFEGFADLLQHSENDALVTRRLSSQAAMKGINGAVVIDAQDDYQQKSANFSGLPDVVAKFQEMVSGAAGMPVTRLFGRSSVGLSGGGEGDERVYFDRVGHDQTTEIQPAMSLLDDCLIYQAVGSRPENIYYEWTPLKQMSESERAEIFSKTANAARALAGAQAGAIIPLDALSDSLVNELTEQGMLPGLDQAVLKYGSLAEQEGFVGGEE